MDPIKAKRKDTGEEIEGYYWYYHDNVCVVPDNSKIEDFQHHMIREIQYNDWELVSFIDHEIDPRTIIKDNFVFIVISNSGEVGMVCNKKEDAEKHIAYLKSTNPKKYNNLSIVKRPIRE